MTCLSGPTLPTVALYASEPGQDIVAVLYEKDLQHARAVAEEDGLDEGRDNSDPQARLWEAYKVRIVSQLLQKGRETQIWVTPASMGEPTDPKAKWDATFADYVNISDLRSATRRAPQYNPCALGYRSVCWKAFLLYQNIDRRSWQKVTRDSRGAYESLKEHLLKDLKAPEGASAVDPLADDANSQYNALKEDEALRAEILQDVERCMPEIPLFRQADIRNMLLNVLFVYCKINADLGYRQGMHELLAPLIWVLHGDSATLSEAKTKPKEPLVSEVLDDNYIEHDSFSLFCVIMQTAKGFYETVSANNTSEKSPSGGGGGSSGESPIVERSRRIHEEYLQKADPELAAHLTAIDILPQIFVIRWIRLLFGREFPFSHVLALWDMIFAEDPALSLIDHVCLAMLLRLRWQLLAADYSTALTLLLRYPEPADAQQTAALLTDAVYLSKHMDLQAGSTIIRKYTNKAPLAALAQSGGDLVKRRGAAHTPSTSADLNRTFKPLRSPAEYLQHQGGIEGILQGAAKNVYSRSEQWGLNKAIRGAVQNLQNNTLTPPRASHGRSSGGGAGDVRWSLDEGRNVSSSALEKELASLQQRNKQLAKMLSEAIEELSSQSKGLEEKKDGDAANALALTVARLQYLQVHLSDSGLPLDSESPAQNKETGPSTSAIPDRFASTSSPSHISRSPPSSPTRKPRPALRPSARLTNNAEKSPPTVTVLSAPDVEPRTASPFSSLNDTSASSGTTADTEDTFDPLTGDPSTAAAAAATPSSQKTPPRATSVRRQPGNFAQPRPSLAESSYSWMLGDDRKESSSASLTVGGGFTDSSAISPGQEREELVKRKSAARSKAGFLFGDRDEGASGAGGGSGGNVKKPGSKGLKSGGAGGSGSRRGSGVAAGDRKGKGVSGPDGDDDDGFTLGELKGGISSSEGHGGDAGEKSKPGDTGNGKQASEGTRGAEKPADKGGPL